jgi:formate-nitrite transporter family protein
MTRDERGDEEHDEKEAKAGDEHIPEGEVVYRAIRQDGDHALGESSASLAWSGLAAGVSMGFSLAGEGLLKAHLPVTVWTPLVSKFGYALGFLMVIFGRQQLFTEQTLTAMLPLLSARRAPGVGVNVARLWIIVLAANLAGAAAFAAAAAWTPAFSPQVQAAFLHIGQDALAPTGDATFIRGIYAGFSLRRWSGCFREPAHPGFGSLSYSPTSSASPVLRMSSPAPPSAYSWVFKGEATLSAYVGGFLVPSLLGNSIGGVALVASLAHGQHAPERCCDGIAGYRESAASCPLSANRGSTRRRPAACLDEPFRHQEG